MSYPWRLASIGVASVILAVSTSAQGVAEVDRNRDVVRQHLALVNAGKWKEASELFAPDVRHHLGSWTDSVERIVQGQKTLAANFEDIFRTFPDWKMEIIDMVAEGDAVVVRCRVSGTHRGIATSRVNGGFLLGVQPTGRHFQVQHIHWYRLRDGRIIDHFASRDDLGMGRQLGLLP